MKLARFRDLTAGLMAMGAIASVAPAFAQQPTLYPVGTLECFTSQRDGFILTQKQGLKCAFHRNDGVSPSHYYGSIGQFGIELGNKTPTTLDWAVFSTVPRPAMGALSGSYQTGGISSGAGPASTGGIVGGVNNGIVLRPYGSNNTGDTDFAAGVTTITLDYIANPDNYEYAAPRRHYRPDNY